MKKNREKEQLAVIYARYSSDKQTEQSIQGQVHVCKDYAKRNNITIVDQYIDRAISGRTDKRPEFQRMIHESSKKNWDLVLVYKLDRFSRDKYEMAIYKKRLKDNGVRLLSAMENIPETPEGVILESLLEGMAQYYSMELSQKVKRGQRESRIKNQTIGGPLNFGYKVVNKKYVVNEEEAKIVRYIFKKVAAGELQSVILEKLHTYGYKERGKPFLSQTLSKLIRNQHYIGKHVDKYGNHFDELYPRIISDKLWNDANNSLSNVCHKRVHSLLAGKAFCGYCGASIVTDSGTSRHGNKIKYYRCRNKKQKLLDCELPTFTQDKLNQLVLKSIEKTVFAEDGITKICDKIKELSEIESKKSNTDELEEQLEKINKQIGNYIDAIALSGFNDLIKAKLDELNLAKSAIIDKIDKDTSTKIEPVNIHIIKKYLKTAIGKEGKDLINYLVKKIVLYKDHMEIHLNCSNYHDPDSQDVLLSKFPIKARHLEADFKEENHHVVHREYIELYASNLLKKTVVSNNNGGKCND